MDIIQPKKTMDIIQSKMPEMSIKDGGQNNKNTPYGQAAENKIPKKEPGFSCEGGLKRKTTVQVQACTKPKLPKLQPVDSMSHERANGTPDGIETLIGKYNDATVNKNYELAYKILTEIQQCSDVDDAIKLHKRTKLFNKVLIFLLTSDKSSACSESDSSDDESDFSDDENGFSNDCDDKYSKHMSILTDLADQGVDGKKTSIKASRVPYPNISHDLFRLYIAVNQSNKDKYNQWLQIALKNKEMDDVLLLLQNGAQVTKKALQIALNNYDAETCFGIIKKYASVNENAAKIRPDSMKPMQDEVGALNSTLLDLVLDKRDESNKSNITFICNKVKDGLRINEDHLEKTLNNQYIKESMVILLIDEFAKQNAFDKQKGEGISASFLKTALNQRRFSEELITKLGNLVKDINEPLDKSGNTIVHRCFPKILFCQERIKAMVKLGANFNKANNNGDTPLHFIASRLNSYINSRHKVFLDSNQCPTIPFYDNFPNYMKALIKIGVKLDAKNKKDKTALIKAAENGCHEEFAMLLDKQPDINFSENGSKLWEFIHQINSSDDEKSLKDKLMHWEIVDEFHSTKESYVKICSKLFDRLDKSFIDDHFLLGYAVLYGTKELVSKLLNKGADINVESSCIYKETVWKMLEIRKKEKPTDSETVKIETLLKEH